METPNEDLAFLKEQAKTLGIQHSPNIGVDALRAKIADALAEKGPKDPPTEETEEERTRRIRNELQADQLALVRVRITNMDPAKKDLRGEIISVENNFLGTIRKFIPFGEAGEAGYHIPKILYNHLKERKFNQVKTRKGRDDREVLIEQRMVNEYNLEVLPPLTPEELAELRATQGARAGLGD